MGQIEYVYNFYTRFRDTDAYGIVHHSNYFCYFEEARYDFSQKVLKLYEQGVMEELKFPVISAECQYKNAMGYDKEEYQVHLIFKILEGARIQFKYEIRKGDERRVYAKGRTIHAILSEDDKLCVTLPASLAGLKERVDRDE